MSEGRIKFKVYYEDTDSMGIVYHANYLKYFERGRSEFIDSLGKSMRKWNEEGVYFVVYSMNLRFRKPAFLGDIIEVVSKLEFESEFRGIFHQRIEKDGELLVEGDVEVVCIDAERKPREFPMEILKSAKVNISCCT